MKLALVLLVPVLAFSVWQDSRRAENESRLAVVASVVATRDVGVSCPGFWTRLVEVTPNAGWVDFDENGRPGDEMILSAGTCRSLERVWRGEQRSFSCLLSGGCDARTLEAVGGLLTLSHESWHLRGVAHEARTHCYALQSVDAVARGLGIPYGDARVVAARVALDAARAPRGEYHSAQCRPGGRYDLRPETPAWPG